MKTDDDEWSWLAPTDTHYDAEQMEDWGYTLDPSAPTTVREALDLAWELAHPVREGHVIPVGVWLVDRRYNKTTVEKNTFFNISVDEWGAKNIRTLEPLPDPKPDWIDAPAVLARPLPTREEIADVILAESMFGSRTPIAAADAVLALLKGQEA